MTSHAKGLLVRSRFIIFIQKSKVVAHLGVYISYTTFIIACRQFFMGKFVLILTNRFLGVGFFLHSILKFRIWPLLSMKKAAKQQQRLKDEQERLVRNELPSSGHPPHHHSIKAPSVIVNGIHGHRNDRGIDGSGTSKTSNSTRLTILNDSYSWNFMKLNQNDFRNDQIPDNGKTSSS